MNEWKSPLPACLPASTAGHSTTGETWYITSTQGVINPVLAFTINQKSQSNAPSLKFTSPPSDGHNSAPAMHMRPTLRLRHSMPVPSLAACGSACTERSQPPAVSGCCSLSCRCHAQETHTSTAKAARCHDPTHTPPRLVMLCLLLLLLLLLHVT